MKSASAPERSLEERSPLSPEESRGRPPRLRASAQRICARVLRTTLALSVALTFATLPTEARQKRTPKVKPPAGAQEQPTKAPEPEPYRPQVAQLVEILGAVSYLDELCSRGQGDGWRASMQALLEAQALTDHDKEMLAGAFNRGYRGYRMTYRTCTMNARSAIVRFLDEGRRIAREVVDRYGSS